MIKKIITLFLVFSMLFLASCSIFREDNSVSNDDSQPQSPDSTESESVDVSQSEEPSNAEQTKITVFSGESSVTPLRRLISSYHDGKYVDNFGGNHENDGYIEALRVLPVLYWNGPMHIKVSENCKSQSVSIYREGEAPHWEESTTENIDGLSNGIWYINVSVTWQGKYIEQEDKHEYSHCNYYFQLIKAPLDVAGQFIQSQVSFEKIGQIFSIFQGEEQTSRFISTFQIDAQNLGLPCHLISYAPMIRESGFELKHTVHYLPNSEYMNDRQLIYSLYSYRFGLDETDCSEVSIRIMDECLSDVLTQDAANSIKTGNPVISTHEDEDLRFCEDEGTVDYYYSGIRYTYSNGVLSEIYWESNGVRYWINPNGKFLPDLEIDDPYLSNYPLLSYFVYKDSATTAIAWFDAMITADEGQ